VDDLKYDDQVKDEIKTGWGWENMIRSISFLLINMRRQVDSRDREMTILP
jgi:hypothetical protein